MSTGTKDNSNLIAEKYSLQQVKDFKYFRASINQNNNDYNEIKLRISATNKDNYPLEKLLKKLKLFLRRPKKRLYSSFMGSILTCTCKI